MWPLSLFLAKSNNFPPLSPCRFCCVPSMHLLLHSCYCPAGFLMISFWVPAALPVVLLHSCCVPSTHLLLLFCYSLAGLLVIPCWVSAAPSVVFAAFLLQRCWVPIAVPVSMCCSHMHSFLLQSLLQSSQIPAKFLLRPLLLSLHSPAEFLVISCWVLDALPVVFAAFLLLSYRVPAFLLWPVVFLLHFLLQLNRIFNGFLLDSCWIPSAPPCGFCCVPVVQPCWFHAALPLLYVSSPKSHLLRSCHNPA